MGLIVSLERRTPKTSYGQQGSAFRLSSDDVLILNNLTVFLWAYPRSLSVNPRKRLGFSAQALAVYDNPHRRLLTRHVLERKADSGRA